MTTLKKTVLQALNSSITSEYGNYMFYRQAGFWFNKRNYPGIQAYMFRQSAEELSHAQKIEEYIMRRGDIVILDKIQIHEDKLDKWLNPLDVFSAAYQLEQQIYDMHNLNAKLARQEEDELTLKFATEFLELQVKELDELQVIMAKVKQYTAVPGLFYHLDKELRKEHKN